MYIFPNHPKPLGLKEWPRRDTDIRKQCPMPLVIGFGLQLDKKLVSNPPTQKIRVHVHKIDEIPLVQGSKPYNLSIQFRYQEVLSMHAFAPLFCILGGRYPYSTLFFGIVTLTGTPDRFGKNGQQSIQILRCDMANDVRHSLFLVKA